MVSIFSHRYRLFRESYSTKTSLIVSVTSKAYRVLSYWCNISYSVKQKAVFTVIFEIVRPIGRGFENEVLRKIFASKGEEDEGG
jgi:hypothetical protein